ncbi:hypothetical protein EJ06DRAFT_430384 [Trichodelitschia bisporula]|uniref:Apple domain-containing protein n=1 Tax=Trichodelitschia bisporula TaxID=703511 RepID=A0A6G1HWN7_9PEZI|nr:hypothetical protein EJ06DRAFT_430384 [Trichodelitschia bisporula]
MGLRRPSGTCYVKSSVGAVVHNAQVCTGRLVSLSSGSSHNSGSSSSSMSSTSSSSVSSSAGTSSSSSSSVSSSAVSSSVSTSTTTQSSSTSSTSATVVATSPVCPGSNGTTYISVNSPGVSFVVECSKDTSSGNLVTFSGITVFQQCMELCAGDSRCVRVS